MHESDDIPDEAVELRASRAPLVFFGLVVLAGLLTFAYFALRAEAKPYRVAVEVTGCSDECAGGVADRVIFHLERHGLSARLRPRPTASVEDALAQALADDDAGHIVRVEVAAIGEEEGFAPGAIRLAGRVTLTAATVGQRPQEPRVVELVDTASGQDAALLGIGVHGVDAFADAVISELLATPGVADYLTGVPGATELERYEALTTAVGGLDNRASAETAYAESCELTRSELDDGSSVVCLTDGCGEEYALGAVAGGALVQVETGLPVFRIGSSTDVRRAEVPERLDIVPLDGGERRTLVSSRNFYSMGSVSADGRRAAYIDAAPAHFALVVVDVEDGARHVVQVVPSPARLMHPRLNADGSEVAYVLRRHRRGDDHLMVSSISGGARQVLLHGAVGLWFEAATAVGAPPERLLAAVVPGEPERHPPPGFDGGVRDGGVDGGRDAGSSDAGVDTATDGGRDEVYDDLEDAAPTDPDAPPHTYIAVLRPDGEVVARIGGRDRPLVHFVGVAGTTVLVTYQSRYLGCGLGHHDLLTGETRWTRTSTCLRHPRLMPDGTIVGSAFATGEGDPSEDDIELVRVTLDGEFTPLTSNAIRERYPKLAAGGVLFERVGQRRFARHPRTAVCYLALDTP